MKRLNHLEPLDNHLRSMPKPNLSLDKQRQIKHVIQSTRASAKPVKKRNYKGITATIGALAATILFVVLLYGTLGKNPQATSIPFSSFVDEDITKINGEYNEETFTTEDTELINLFYESVGAMDFIKTKGANSGSTQTIELYHKNSVLETMQFGDENMVTIDGITYEVDAAKWDEFEEVFFTEQYMVAEEEKEEEEPEEQPEDTTDYAQLLDEELAKAPSERDWEAILKYVQNGADSDKALLTAAKDERPVMVKQLLELGANPNTITTQKSTPLMLTISTEVAELLIDNGADITLRNAHGYNALVIAVYGHQTEMVKLLLENGAAPNTTVQPNSDVSVLWMAGKYNDQPIADLLIQHGAELVEGYDQESWMMSQIPSLSNMLQDNLLYEASIGRLPGLPSIQVPADSNTFPGRYGEPFESYNVEGGTAFVYGDHIFAKGDGDNLYTRYRYDLNPEDNVTVEDIENALGKPSVVFVDYHKTNNNIAVYNLEHYKLHFHFEEKVNPNNISEEGELLSYSKQRPITSLELIYKQPGIVEHANSVFDLLADNNMNELAQHVHPEKGVLFAPFLQLTSTPMSEEHEPITFSAEEIPSLLQDQTVYTWGIQGASGLPIEMTPANYFDIYVYSKQEADVIYINEQNLTGPEFITDQVRGLFPDAHMVQFSFYETESGYDLSWVDLTLIFEAYNDEWKLVGIMHNAWTP